MKLEIFEEARSQFRKENAWWQANRDAKALFAQEFLGRNFRRRLETSEECLGPGRSCREARADGSEMADTAIELAPDWVCEVLSDGTERVDRTKKRRIYAREGVSHLWLVSPDQRVLEVFRLQGEHWVLLETFEGDSAVRAEPFDAIELPLGSLWEL